MQPHGKVAFQVFGLKLRSATMSILRIHYFDKTVCTAHTMVHLTENLSTIIKIEIKGWGSLQVSRIRKWEEQPNGKVKLNVFCFKLWNAGGGMRLH